MLLSERQIVPPAPALTVAPLRFAPSKAPRSFHERDAFANCLANAALDPPVFASLAGQEEGRACFLLLTPERSEERGVQSGVRQAIGERIALMK